MRRVDERQFAASPAGTYVQGPTYLAWCASPRLYGGMDWGDPTDTDVQAMIRLASVVYDQPGTYDVVIDSRNLLALRPATFDAYARLMTKRLPDLRTKVRRHAIIAPPNAIGALLAGLYPILGRAVPNHRVFTRVEDAGRWLGGDAAQALGFVDALGRSLVPTLRPLSALTAYLREHPSATLTTAARHLEVSERSLQRQLLLNDTSFRAVLAQVRLDVARQALHATDDKLHTIAHQVGFRTASHFCAWFRRNTGLTPDDFRQRARRAQR